MTGSVSLFVGAGVGGTLDVVSGISFIRRRESASFDWDLMNKSGIVIIPFNTR